MRRPLGPLAGALVVSSCCRPWRRTRRRRSQCSRADRPGDGGRHGARTRRRTVGPARGRTTSACRSTASPARSRRCACFARTRRPRRVRPSDPARVAVPANARLFILVVDRDNIPAGEGRQMLEAATRFVDALPAQRPRRLLDHPLGVGPLPLRDRSRRVEEGHPVGRRHLPHSDDRRTARPRAVQHQPGEALAIDQGRGTCWIR